MVDWVCAVPSSRLLWRRERETNNKPGSLEQELDPLLADKLLYSLARNMSLLTKSLNNFGPNADNYLHIEQRI